MNTIWFYIKSITMLNARTKPGSQAVCTIYTWIQFIYVKLINIAEFKKLRFITATGKVNCEIVYLEK